ncbi:MAG: hypothetical protein HXY30_16230 [Pseudorhodoplanes sp.]|nr:hypothetical protein [Pseudorhodoplanes sp.]
MPLKHGQVSGRSQPPKRPTPPDESVDEPAALIERETADIEAEVPQTPNPNIDRGEKDEPTPPAFEE